MIKILFCVLVYVTVANLFSNDDRSIGFKGECIQLFGELRDEIRGSILELSTSNPFVEFDMKLTGDDINCLSNLRIDSNNNYYNEYNNFGDLDNLSYGLFAFLRSLGNEVETSESASTLISNLVNQVIIATGKETAWITLRASTATANFDTPRWHRDGYFYDLDLATPDEQYKVVMAFKGPPTLFYNLPDGMRNEFNLLSMSDKRDALSQLLNINQSVSAKPYHGAVFIVGADYAAVHSEPPIHEDRLFLSILPGSEKQIRELYNRWHPVEQDKSLN